MNKRHEFIPIEPKLLITLIITIIFTRLCDPLPPFNVGYIVFTLHLNETQHCLVGRGVIVNKRHEFILIELKLSLTGFVHDCSSFARSRLSSFQLSDLQAFFRDSHFFGILISW